MMHRSRFSLLGLLLVGLVLLAWTYRDTLALIIEKWQSDAAFSHGFLIVPVSLWLIWRRRRDLATVRCVPSWIGVVALLLCAALWMVGRGAGVLVIEQFGVVLMIPALVLALIGWPATKILLFPLAFLLFAVPFGRALVPYLMEATADVATVALRWTGVPLFRSNMYISIPSGEFEVARACSGLNYVITGLVLGVLYAYVSYQGWRKRALCVAAFVVVPIVANGVRVYFTILVSHLTEMRFGPGTEHVMFGRVFFILVMLAMFWIGRRWHDVGTPAGGHVDSVPAPDLRIADWAPVPAAFLLVLLAPAYLSQSVAGAAAGLADARQLATLPPAASGWEGPVEDESAWRPSFQGAAVVRSGVYRGADQSPVDVFGAVYGLGPHAESEMISFGNDLVPQEGASLLEERRRVVRSPDGGEIEVREALVPDAAGPRLVWQWFMVGDRVAVSPFHVKALEALALVTRGARDERVLTLATPDGDGARERLEAFFAAHAACLRGGLAPESCGG